MSDPHALTDLPEPSLSARERAKAELLRRLGSRVVFEEELCAEYRSDDSRVEGALPDAVVLAECDDDVAAALEVAAWAGVPVTPRAGGSGRTGGAVPVQGGIVVSVAGRRGLVELDVAEGLAVVAPGTLLADLHAAVEREGWFYPPDPNSAELCCLAGNVAENAAGPRALKYGATRDWVLGLDVLLTTGARFFSGRRTRKGVTGYDVTSLLVGSEGTLAAFGNVTLKLAPKPEQVMTLLGLFSDMGAAARAVEGIVAARLLPRCLEFLDEATLAVMRAAGNALDARAGAMLLIEVDGSEEATARHAERVGACCDEAGALSVVVAQSESQRARLWDARRQMSYAVRARAKHKLSEDVVVPRTRLGALLEEVKLLADRHRIEALAYGHAGDGNLHVNLLWNEPEELPRVEAATLDLFRATLALGGTLSGEHGIGLLKAPYLALEQPAVLIDLQRRLKAQFDPSGVLNPGKIFPRRGHTAC
jgi:glycolate oxidase